MADTRGIRTIGVIAAVLALLALAAAFVVFTRTAVRTRPWILEANLEWRMTECRTGPGAYSFAREYALLADRADEAKRALAETDGRWWVWRDYSDSIHRLASALLDAQLFKLKLAQRQQEEEARLALLLSTLKQSLGSDVPNGKIWSRFGLGGLEQSRARSLVRQAEYLDSQGEVESALNHALRAWASWRKFNDQADVEFARFENPGLLKKWDQDAVGLLDWTKARARRAILVDKLEHRCLVLNRGQIERSYPAALGRNWHRQKARESDASTPEGRYRVRRMIPSGRYGFALLLDYPNSADRERFAALKLYGGISSDSRIGGSVEIHGGGRLDSDWTDGCVSLDDDDMRDLYRLSYVGMPVTIVGTCRLTSSWQDR